MTTGRLCGARMKLTIGGICSSVIWPRPREDGLDKATRIFGLEAADLLVAQAMVVQQRREFRRGPQAGRCVASRWHDPGARQGLEDPEVNEPGQQRAVDRVIDDTLPGLSTRAACSMTRSGSAVISSVSA